MKNDIETLIEQREQDIYRIDVFLMTKFDMERVDCSLLSPTILDLIKGNKISRLARLSYWLRVQKWWFLAPMIVLFIAGVIATSIYFYDARYYPFTVETSKNDRLTSSGQNYCLHGGACAPAYLVESINETLNEMKAGDQTLVSTDDEDWQIRRTDKRFIIVVDRKR
jgi:hypothetical protein